jgi:hypothetical protein
MVTYKIVSAVNLKRFTEKGASASLFVLTQPPLLVGEGAGIVRSLSNPAVCQLMQTTPQKETISV